jgi:predicted Rossmann-fold nucleotide-binding protein
LSKSVVKINPRIKKYNKIVMQCVFDDYDKNRKNIESSNFPNGIWALGSARIGENDKHYLEIVDVAEQTAREIKRLNKNLSFITGGGPSVMKA